MRSTAKSYYNAMLAAGRVRALTLNEAQRDLDRVNLVVEYPALYGI